MYEIYHFTEQSKDLFSTYIDRFLKVKQVASGWPAQFQMPKTELSFPFSYKGEAIFSENVIIAGI